MSNRSTSVPALVLFLCAMSAPTSIASAQLRVATWNISNYTGANRANDIRTVVYGVNAANGLSMRPDVLAVQELVSASALSTLVSVLNTAPGSPGDWAAAPYFDDPNYGDTESGFVYRTSKVVLVGAFVIADADGTVNDQPRSTYRYDFRPVGYSAASATTGLYSVHLKAGSTSTDNDRRLIETTRIRTNAQGQDTNPNNGVSDGLPAGYNFMLAGDTNVQNATQSAYVQLVGSMANNNGRFFDPIREGFNSNATGDNGSWNNNIAYRFIHTQDPANAGGGGMDDRHDQILLSSSLLDGQGLHYIGNHNISYSNTTWDDPNHSYRAWGNDGTSYNAGLTVTGNTMVGATIAQALINVATASGGHLPVYLDMRVPAKITTDVTVLDFGTVVQGSLPPVRTINVTNSGDVSLWGANGIDALTYTLGTAPGFVVPGGTFNEPAGGGSNSHNLSMLTTTVGVKNTTMVISSDDPDQPTRVIQLVGTVVPPNTPPTANAGPDQSVPDSDNSGSELITLDGSGSSDSDGTIVEYLWREGGVDLAAPSSSPTLTLPMTVGTHTITLRVTDNLGAIATDEVVIIVTPYVPPVCDSIDFNNDGLFPDLLDVDDYLSVFGGGACSNDPNCNDIDFNNDGLFPDSLDIDSLLSVFSGGGCL